MYLGKAAEIASFHYDRKNPVAYLKFKVQPEDLQTHGAVLLQDIYFNQDYNCWKVYADGL